MADKAKAMDDLPTALRLEIAAENRRLPLGALLRAEGAISAEQLERALVDVEARGLRLGEVLLEQRAISTRVRSKSVV